ncbi:MAG: universal stress protein [Halorhodospira sp.]
MTHEEHATPRQPHRIVVLLDASRASMASLEAAAEFAAQRRAELVAIYVEEEELLRCAGYPWAQEVGLSGAVRPLDTGIEQERMRARAEGIRHAVRRAAQRRGLTGQLHICRGRVVRETLALIEDNDLIVLGKVGYAHARGLRLGSSARAIVHDAPGPVMVFEEPIGSRRRHGVAVVTEGSEQGVRTLKTAAALLGQEESLAMVIAEGDPGKSLPENDPARRWISQHFPHARWLPHTIATPSALAQALAAAPVDKLIISRRSRLLAHHEPRSLIEAIQLPVLVIP